MKVGLKIRSGKGEMLDHMVQLMLNMICNLLTL